MYFNNLLTYILISIFLSRMFLTQLKLILLLKKNNNIFNKTMSLHLISNNNELMYREKSNFRHH